MRKGVILLLPLTTFALIFSTLQTINPIEVSAKSGCCSSHGGVSCSAGPQSNGRVICNDGWTGSSCYYSEMVMCGGSTYTPVSTPAPTPVPTLPPTPRPTPRPTIAPTKSPTSTPTPFPSATPIATTEPTQTPQVESASTTNDQNTSSSGDLSGILLPVLVGGAWLVRKALHKE